jgi:SAM-dependent methyltransferase
MQHGYSVVAFDASSEMCRMASELIGQDVLQMRFDEMAFEDEFDGIWACASLLHVPTDDLPDILGKVRKALKTQGILYISFKYGEGTKIRGERSFSDFTEASVRVMLDQAEFDILECGVTSDIRPGRADEKWVNVIAQKKEQGS